MKIFRGFYAILTKEFIIVLRDPVTLFFMLFPPLVEMIAFGFALDNDVKHMATIVLNEDRTVESRQLIDAFKQSVATIMAEANRRTVPIEVRAQMLYNPSMRSPNFYIPGVIGVVLQIATTFATAMSVVRERERGTLEQLLVSPLSRWG